MKLQDTLSNSEQVLDISKKVKIYLCGVTVYDESHVGHARTIIVFDVLRKYLESKGIDVDFVQNFTDVDDKIINRARLENTTAEQISSKYIQNYFTDFDGLNVKRATNYPKATEHIDDIENFIKKLVEKDIAYVTKNGVYFSVSKFPQYGKLSKKKIDELQSGARIEVDEAKKDPLDFALWKFSDVEPIWDSPWGKGRPGWHIECSAMSVRYLGENFDIHGGGRDLIFPHHENEIAQSECATGHPFVKYWVHYAFLQVDGEKMSKSKQNGYTIDDIREKNINPLALRLLFMQTHYRKPLNFTWESAQGAQTSFDRLHAFAVLHHDITIDTVAPSEQYLDSFKEALGDDLNTAKALAVVWQLLSDKTVPIEQKKKTLFAFDEVLGLDLKNIEPIVIPEHVTTLLKERSEARAQKNWQVSDQLRTEIEKSGFTVIDTEDGSIAQKI